MKLWTQLGFTLLLTTSICAQEGSPTPFLETEATPATPVTPATPEEETGVTDSETSSASIEVTVTPADSKTSAPDQQCAGKDNFHQCNDPKFNCLENSLCFCKEEKPFCRCNNDEDKWYIGENCDQEWTVVTFGLVASLPGIGLAIIVGLVVHFVHNSKKKGKAKRSQTQKTVPQLPSKKESSQADMYSNIVFAADVQNPQPASGRTSHDSIPMAANPYSAYRNEAYKNPHFVSNPSKNPYNSHDRYEAYRNPMAPSARQNGTPGSTPLYSTPDYNSSRQQFPRAQMGRHY